MKEKEKAIVLYSGGLDSRLVIALLKDKYTVEALYFSLPFGCGERNARTHFSNNLVSGILRERCNMECNFNFTQKLGVKLTRIDCSKGKLLKEYLEVIKKPNHGVGSGINPCKDCKIWMFRKSKEYADKHKIKIIATGEVVGQRPMSQTRKSLDLIDRKLGFKIYRPLIEIGFEGRKRTKQIELAKKLNINYPTPAGGCLLCEKLLMRRFRVLLDNNLISEKTLCLVHIGRHFFDKNWFVVSRNEKESMIIDSFKKSIKSDKGKPGVYYSEEKEVALKLQEAYAKKDKKMLNQFQVLKI